MPNVPIAHSIAHVSDDRSGSGGHRGQLPCSLGFPSSGQTSVATRAHAVPLATGGSDTLSGIGRSDSTETAVGRGDFTRYFSCCWKFCQSFPPGRSCSLRSWSMSVLTASRMRSVRLRKVRLETLSPQLVPLRAIVKFKRKFFPEVLPPGLDIPWCVLGFSYMTGRAHYKIHSGKDRIQIGPVVA